MPARHLLGLLLLVLASACARHNPPAAPAAAVASATAASPSGSDATAGAAGPRLTMSPDGVHIEYRVLGQGEPALLLIHGWAADANYWSEQLTPLAAHYTVVPLNLAGHGGSGANRSDWSIGNYAADVAAVARQLSNQHLVLIGHAMGATVALAAAPLIGARVDGIVAVEALRSVGEPPLAAPEIARRVAPFRSDFVGATRRLVAESLFRRDASHALVQKVAYDMSLEPPAIGIASLEALLSFDFAPLLPQLHLPVYTINSDLVPTDAARLRRSLPGASLEVLAHSDHFLMLEDAARFNPLLLKDVAALAAPAPH
jgi:pimeloyl-ACP methyl ester carboxylesterase